MSDENFDDGLVHGHSWASSAPEMGTHPVAHADGACTPSTTVHDDLMFGD